MADVKFCPWQIWGHNDIRLLDNAIGIRGPATVALHIVGIQQSGFLSHMRHLEMEIFIKR